MVWISSKSEVSDFSGWQKPPISGSTIIERSPSSNLAELFQSKVMCENLDQIGWAFQEYRVHKQTNIQPSKKKKSQMQLKTISFGKIIFRTDNNNTKVNNTDDNDNNDYRGTP